MKEKVTFLNTLGRKKEDFTPIDETEVKMYTCGPTVYGRAHIGNLRAYIFADITRRVLEYAGYNVKQVMNITDVGHLTSDADEGEDKLQRAAKEDKVTAWEISKRFTEKFLEDTSELNIQPVQVLCRATDHIADQITLVKKIEERGNAYITSDGVYFDTSKFSRYADFANLNIEGLSAGKRINMGEKRNKTDFALWKFSKPNENRDMEWDSPWGTGFPGWHIECSAMSMKYLGETFDIHTGGIDHIPIHHTNEIAQSETATGKKFVNYWLHSDFLVMSDQEKMSKSLGNVITLDTLKEAGVEPLAYRYLCLGAHYRKRLLYGEEILKNAVISYSGLKKNVVSLKEKGAKTIPLGELCELADSYLKKFKKVVFNDLNTPQGLAVMWGTIKEKRLFPDEKYTLLADYDKVFALGIAKMKEETVEIPEAILALFNKRNKARLAKNWQESDRLRNELSSKGYAILDTPKGTKIEKK